MAILSGLILLFIPNLNLILVLSFGLSAVLAVVFEGHFYSPFPALVWLLQLFGLGLN